MKNQGEKNVLIYKTENFVDLCKGPHIESTKDIDLAFKLDRISGAYFKGDETRPMLTRIYGLAFEDKKSLEEYIKIRELVKERDHRKLGKVLEIFMFSELVGQGLVLLQPAGAIIIEELKKFLKEEHFKRGYSEVITPHIGRIMLYEISGHLKYYKDSMYSPFKIEDDEYIVKPMNCPFHIQIYKSRPRSFRELPLRLAEFGTVYRYEKSGELTGLTRVRGFTQDDAHIFCTPDQLESEFLEVVDLVAKIFNTLGFKKFVVRVSIKDKNSNKYIGNNEIWEKSEFAILNAVRKVNMNYIIGKGEAAFYGPKLDFIVKDVLGKKWQLGTIQVDYNLPERFNLYYIGKDGRKHRPVMIHRAPFGSLERFLGILIEHFEGAFPVWLSPYQLILLPVGKKHITKCQEYQQELNKEFVRVKIDSENETIPYKIRKYMKLKVPYIGVIGDKELKNNSITIRFRKLNITKEFKFKEFKEKLLDIIKKRKLDISL